MSSSPPLESLTNSDLRQKLLQYGYDLPTSVNKDFLIKKLNSLMQDKDKDHVKGRKSVAEKKPDRPVPVAARSTTPTPPQPINTRTNGGSNTVLPRAKSLSNTFAAETPSQQRVYYQEDEGPTPNKLVACSRSMLSFSNSQSQESEEDDEYEEDDEIENRTPSPRYQKYLSYFQGDTSRSDPFVMPRTRYSTPAGSPYSTTATAGSPSFRAHSYSLDDSGDESDTELPREESKSFIRTAFSKVNPLNWIPNPKSWFISKPGNRNQTDNLNMSKPNFNFGSGSSAGIPPTTPLTSRFVPPNNANANSRVNGNLASRSSLMANHIYSPVQPPPPPPVVPPAIAAGRQAGFKAFFSRGERNGYGYSTTEVPTTDKAHIIPKLLILGLMVGIAAVLGSYYYKTSVVPKGLPGSDSDVESIRNLFEAGKTPIHPETNNYTPKQRVVPPTKITYPICGTPGYESDPCVPKKLIRDCSTLFEALKRELSQRSAEKSCGFEVQDKMSLKQAKELLYRLVDLKKTDVDAAFQKMLMLVTENPLSGFKIEIAEKSGDVTINDVMSLDNDSTMISIQGISPSFLCVVYGGFITFVSYLSFIGLFAALLYALFKLEMWRRTRKTKEDDELYALVHKVIQLLHEHYEDSKNTGQPDYLAIDQIRDTLFQPRERKEKEALWNNVVALISTKESRVREEIQHLSGEEFRVWRWLPSASPLTKRMSSAPSSPIGGSGDALPASPTRMYPNLSTMSMEMDNSTASNSQWQGQAFEIFDGSPNSLAQPPSTCLKIRQMYDNSKDIGDNHIEQAILQKCSQAQILHIGVDRTSREGCVYIRCLNKRDAQIAYRALHGWWFDGHLLSVKFLREDRYLTRFPDSQFRTTPLNLTNLPPASSSPAFQPQAARQF